MYKRTLTRSISSNQYINLWAERGSIMREAFKILNLDMSNIHSVRPKYYDDYTMRLIYTRMLPTLFGLFLWANIIKIYEILFNCPYFFNISKVSQVLNPMFISFAILLLNYRDIFGSCGLSNSSGAQTRPVFGLVIGCDQGNTPRVTVNMLLDKSTLRDINSNVLKNAFSKRWKVGMKSYGEEGISAL